MSYILKFQAFFKNSETDKTFATFNNMETREVVTATPVNPEDQALFCQVMKSSHTAKLKDDGKTITVRFPLSWCSINTFSKDKDGNDVMTISPADGCKDLCKASEVLYRPEDGTVSRQIAFVCEVTSSKSSVRSFDFGLEEGLYPDSNHISDR